MMDKLNVPPPADEEPISYIYNRGTQTVHKWPGCRAVAAVVRNARGARARIEYWSPSQYGEAIRERGAIRRCRLCFGKPGEAQRQARALRDRPGK